MKKKREEDEKKKRKEKVGEVESRIKEKGKKEIKEGKTTIDGDTHNATADFAREQTKNAGWRERSEGEKSYLSPDFGQWSNQQVRQWIDQNNFSESV